MEKNWVLQVALRSGATERVCWIDKNVNVGDVVTLKKDEYDLCWEVTAVYASANPLQINRHWNNNI